MEPLKPMKPMSPMAPPKRWWSDDLGEPTSSGAQDGARYAFFNDQKLLLIERSGKLQRFRTGEHRITGVAQVSGGGALTFTSAEGSLKLDDFETVG